VRGSRGFRSPAADPSIRSLTLGPPDCSHLKRPRRTRRFRVGCAAAMVRSGRGLVRSPSEQGAAPFEADVARVPTGLGGRKARCQTCKVTADESCGQANSADPAASPGTSSQSVASQLRRCRRLFVPVQKRPGYSLVLGSRHRASPKVRVPGLYTDEALTASIEGYRGHIQTCSTSAGADHLARNDLLSSRPTILCS